MTFESQQGRTFSPFLDRNSTEPASFSFSSSTLHLLTSASFRAFILQTRLSCFPRAVWASLRQYEPCRASTRFLLLLFSRSSPTEPVLTLPPCSISSTRSRSSFEHSRARQRDRRPLPALDASRLYRLTLRPRGITCYVAREGSFLSPLCLRSSLCCSPADVVLLAFCFSFIGSPSLSLHSLQQGKIRISKSFVTCNTAVNREAHSATREREREVSTVRVKRWECLQSDQGVEARGRRESCTGERAKRYRYRQGRRTEDERRENGA